MLSMKFENNDVKLTAIDTVALTITLSVNEVEASNKIERILFVMGIIVTKEDDSPIRLVCKLNSKVAFERFIKLIADWTNTTEGSLMTSPMFKRFKRMTEEHEEHKENN